MRRLAVPAFLAMTCALPSVAMDEETTAFVESNLLSTFYHEVGHAFIDVLNLPVHGPEEDAADTLSVVLIDHYYTEEIANEVIVDAAASFRFYADEAGDDVIFWGVHGADEQRYYNTVCLYYGADPDRRDIIANTLELPGERAETCEEEFALARDSWAPALDDVFGAAEGPAFRFHRSGLDGEAAELLDALMAREIEALNDGMSRPAPIEVRVEYCDVENAFYQPDEELIVMCVELAEQFARVAQAANQPGARATTGRID